MKKNYMKPELLVAAMENKTQLLGSSVTKLNSVNATMSLGGGSSNNISGQVRTKERGLWDDEEEWEEDW